MWAWTLGISLSSISKALHSHFIPGFLLYYFSICFPKNDNRIFAYNSRELLRPEIVRLATRFYGERGQLVSDIYGVESGDELMTFNAVFLVEAAGRTGI